LGKALHGKAKFTFKGRIKAVTLPGEAILASPITRKKALKAKPKASQSKGANIQSHRVSVIDRLAPVNIDLRDYLRKIRLRCQIGDLKSEVTCYAIDADTSYNLLLGRP